MGISSIVSVIAVILLIVVLALRFLGGTKPTTAADTASEAAITATQTATSTSTTPSTTPAAAAITACPTNAYFPTTAVGATASGTCPEGYTGTQRAVCKADGSYDTADTTGCTKTITACAADSTFPTTSVGQTAVAACPSGYNGNQTATCQSDGSFTASNKSGCSQIVACPPSGSFPTTIVGETASSKDCPTGYTGVKTAMCRPDGSFSEADITKCFPSLTAEQLTTPWNQEGGFNYFFDRHDVACPASSGMSQFHYARDGRGNFQEQYTCQKAGDIGATTSHVTAATTGGNLMDGFNNHDMKCPAGSVINQWHMHRPSSSQIAFDYKCAPVPALGTCTKHSTPGQTHGNGLTMYLDRHNVSCPNNEMLSQIKYVTDGTTAKYDYTCCARP